MELLVALAVFMMWAAIVAIPIWLIATMRRRAAQVDRLERRVEALELLEESDARRSANEPR